MYIYKILLLLPFSGHHFDKNEIHVIEQVIQVEQVSQQWFKDDRAIFQKVKKSKFFDSYENLQKHTWGSGQLINKNEKLITILVFEPQVLKNGKFCENLENAENSFY